MSSSNDKKKEFIVLLQNSIASTIISKEYEANLTAPLCKLCNYFKADSRKSYGKLGYCSKNCLMAKEHRLCAECLDFKIHRSTPDWITTCSDCPVYRVCVECLRKDIASNQPTYDTKCLRCLEL